MYNNARCFKYYLSISCVIIGWLVGEKGPGRGRGKACSIDQTFGLKLLKNKQQVVVVEWSNDLWPALIF